MGHFHCFTVLQEAFKMPNYTTVYMDVWSLDELKSCRKVMWPQMPISDMTERYDRWINHSIHSEGRPPEDHQLQSALLA